MNEIITFFTHFIIGIIEKSGYLGVFTLMAAESALITIPSEVTMPFAGFLASAGKMNLYLVILTGALANLFGSLLAYALGWWGEEHLIRSLIKKYGKYVLVSEHEYDRSERWFRRYGEKIVFFSRVLPIVRTFISLPAGIAKMNLLRFSIFTFLGSLIWSAFLTYIGFMLGKNWHSIEGVYRQFEYLIVICVFLLGLYYVAHKLKKVNRK
ncbi:DedA family protein [Candidatus Roizmanbacteria bacterium]|nr:DedA family protein [Candidatus Roizmanbacteria bacterium]